MKIKSNCAGPPVSVSNSKWWIPQDRTRLHHDASDRATQESLDHVSGRCAFSKSKLPLLNKDITSEPSDHSHCMSLQWLAGHVTLNFSHSATKQLAGTISNHPPPSSFVSTAQILTRSHRMVLEGTPSDLCPSSSSSLVSFLFVLLDWKTSERREREREEG